MKSKQKKINAFDANGVGIKGNNIFGLPFDENESEVIIIPVPWEVTVSYAQGTADGPEAVFKASYQVDLFDREIKDAWKTGIYMLEIPNDLKKKSNKYRKKAISIIQQLEQGVSQDDTSLKKDYQEINEACEKMNEYVKETTYKYLKAGKCVALLGGDHSTPLGFFQALNAMGKPFSILQIDAHADLRTAYEGFQYSHASIMTNALQLENIEKLVQVGIRDFCEEEYLTVKNSNGRVICFYDEDIKNAKIEGRTFKKITQEIINSLGDLVYISFDIDGLDPKYCPNTGTPVAGGFEVSEVLYLIKKLQESGKTIIGFDLNEVAPGNDEWDANVAARLLYKFCNTMAVSQGKIYDEK
jgi:agmatinase